MREYKITLDLSEEDGAVLDQQVERAVDWLVQDQPAGYTVMLDVYDDDSQTWGALQTWHMETDDVVLGRLADAVGDPASTDAQIAEAAREAVRLARRA